MCHLNPCTAMQILNDIKMLKHRYLKMLGALVCLINILKLEY